MFIFPRRFPRATKLDIAVDRKLRVLMISHIGSFYMKLSSFFYGLCSRRGVHEDGHRNYGGAGLVSGSAGDDPDASFRLRHGFVKGKHCKNF